MGGGKQRLLSTEDATLLAMIMAVQSIVGAVANAVVMAFFLIKRRERKTAADKLTVNLAMADFVALTTYVPWRAYLLHLRTTTKESKYYTSLFVVCIFCTGNAVLLVSFDRFVAVMRPLRYQTLMTSKVVLLSIALSWITAIVLGAGHGLSYDLQLHSEYELFLCALSFCQLLTISIIYATIFKIARSHHARTMATDTSRGRYLRKTVLYTFFIICLFYATFLPYSVYRIVSTIDETLSKNDKRTTWRWLIVFTFLNSCINPFIYLFTTRRFCSYLKRYFQIRFQTNGD